MWASHATPVFLATFATSPAIVGWGLLLTAIGWSVRFNLNNSDSQFRCWGWWILLAAVLLTFRWPLIWLPHELYPDESQLIAGAMTLRHDPIFWRSVDGGTAGPLDYFILLPTTLFSGTTLYAATRVTAALLIWGTLVATGESLARITNHRITRIAVLPAVVFAALTTSPEFVHYSTELLPGFLLALSLWFIVRQSTRPSRWNLWGAALLLGSLPFAKLQVGPIAAALGLLLVIIEIKSGRFKNTGLLLVVALLPTLLITLLLGFTGNIEDMVIPYFLQNILYAQTGREPFGQVLRQFWEQSYINGYHALWLAGCLIFCTGALAFAHNSPRQLQACVLVAAALFGVTLFCILSPGRPYHHYLNLLTLPMTLLTGLALASLINGSKSRSWMPVGLFALCCLVPQLGWWAMHRPDPYEYYNTVASARGPEQHQLVALIQSYSHPGESLGLWGWRSSLYVETGLVQGTRLAHTESVFVAGPSQKYYLRRYYEDMVAANPPVFADTAGPGNFRFDRRSMGHEVFPLLRDWVSSHYKLVADLDGVRLYVRHDRTP